MQYFSIIFLLLLVSQFKQEEIEQATNTQQISRNTSSSRNFKYFMVLSKKNNLFYFNFEIKNLRHNP